VLLWPDSRDKASPGAGELLVSPYNVAFLLGVLGYFLRQRFADLRLWLPVLALFLLAVGYQQCPRPELSILSRSVGCALLVWWGATARPVAADHPLVAYGDYSYGTYLVHAALIIADFTRGAGHRWMPPSLASMFAVGLGALLAGLLFGRLETALYQRLRRLVQRPARQPTTLPPPRARAA
jgi:peptidoglycan/LPS O-acetylase OafA/YrhL